MSTHLQSKPLLALTPGEAAGIGPDLCIMLAQEPPAAGLVVIGDPGLLKNRARQLGLPLELHTYNEFGPAAVTGKGRLAILPVALAAPSEPGRLDPRNAPYIVETLRQAVDGCRAGRFAAMVTGPVHKGVINDAGIPFTGHTEFLAERCGVARPVMMLATEGLRVALVTTHLPLREVSAHITREAITEVISIVNQELQVRLGIARPRLLVCGLNPHAGEGGHLGREEIEVIEPALHELRAQGIEVLGPLPADTLFTPKHLRQADAVIAMYHDQGLPVLKHMGFGRAVNITLGLPIVRTSVDHGTALDLAGSGRADPSSLRYAVEVAIQFCGGRPA